MDPSLIGLLALGSLLLLLILGVPVAVALGSIGLLGMALTAGSNFALTTALSLPYGFSANYVWTAMPLFILMGNLCAESGITKDLFAATEQMLRRVRGGIYLATVISSALFSAISGSTVVNSVVFTRLALPNMLQMGYSKALSFGCICASGTFAAMIPPSLTLVLLGLLTDQSIGRLFIAGIIPGLLSLVVYTITILLLVNLRPQLAPKPADQKDKKKENLQSLRRSWPAAALFCLVLGGIYLGWFAPSSAGAVGAGGAFLLCVQRCGPGRWLFNALRDSVTVTSSILIILIGGLLFSRFLVVSGVVDTLTSLVVERASSPILLILWLALFYILIGLVLDTASIMIVTLPIVFPMVQHAGIDPIWFSVLFTKFIEVAVFSPPIGVNIFATLSAAGEHADLYSLCKGVLPFLLAEVIMIVILILFPSLSTWLPDLMM